MNMDNLSSKIIFILKKNARPVRLKGPNTLRKRNIANATRKVMGTPEPERGGSKKDFPDEPEAIGANAYPIFHYLRDEAHSMTAMDYMLGQGSYPLKGLFITAANPAVTNPNTAKVEEIFVVAQQQFFTHGYDGGALASKRQVHCTQVAYHRQAGLGGDGSPTSKLAGHMWRHVEGGMPV